MKNYQFKLGQLYKVTESSTDHFIKGNYYEVVKCNNINVLTSELDIRFRDHTFDNPSYPTYSVTLELVGDSKEEVFRSTIEIDFLIDYINNHNLESNEIIAFLAGYKNGQSILNKIKEEL